MSSITKDQNDINKKFNYSREVKKYRGLAGFVCFAGLTIEVSEMS